MAVAHGCHIFSEDVKLIIGLKRELETASTNPQNDSVHFICDVLEKIYESVSKWNGFDPNTRAKIGDINLIGEVRLLDQIVGRVKKLPKQDIKGNSGEYWQTVCSVIIHLLWQTHHVPKINRKLLQIVKELECKFPVIIGELLTDSCVGLSAISPPSLFALWSGLISSTAVVQRIACSRLAQLLGVAAEQLQKQVGGSCDGIWTLHRQDCLQAVTKLLLELLQRCPESVRESFTSDQSVLVWQLIVAGLVAVIQNDGSPKDCCLVAGTALTNLMVLCVADGSWVGTAATVFKKLGNGGTIACGPLSFEIQPTEHATSELQFGHLSLANGFLAMSDSTTLLHLIITEHEGHRIPLVFWLFSKISQLCYSTSFPFQAFRLLSQWFSKVAKYQNKMFRAGMTLFAAEGEVTMATLGLVWTNLDSPVDGVNEIILEILDRLLQLENQEYCLITSKYPQYNSTDMSSDLTQQNEKNSLKDKGVNDCVSLLVPSLLPRVLAMSWEIRGRHSLASVLLRHTDAVMLLRDHPKILQDIPNCLGTNYLTPAVTNLYIVVMDNLRCSANPVALWEELCLPVVMETICSEDQLLRLNCSQYLVPVTLKKIPATFAVIQRHLDLKLSEGYHGDSEATLHGYLALLKTARHNKILKQWPTQLLSEAVVHPEDDIRLDALTLICVSPRASESLSVDECALLYACLRDNMNSDESRFRQRVQVNIYHSVARARDGGLAALRVRHAGKGDGSYLTQAIEYIDWLWRLCIGELHPASNYQRQKTCLDWMAVILDGLTPRSDRRKGGCPAQTVDLVSAAQASGRWTFYSEDSQRALLGCLLHDTDEIKEQAADILQRFFPWPLEQEAVAPPVGSAENLTESRAIVACRLMTQALSLSNSPRARECESGAVFCRLLFSKYVAELGYNFTIELNEGKFNVAMTTVTNTESALINFFTTFAELLEKSAQCAEANVLEAARILPAHGIVQACHYCLSACKNSVQHKQLWQSVTSRLISTVTKIVDLVLTVFGVRLKSQETAPSFQKMGVSIQEVVKQSGSQPTNQDAEEAGLDLSSAHEGTILTPEHQMVMTWCWTNIRECSVLLSRLVQSLSVCPPGDETSSAVVTVTQVEDIADTLVNVLTKCRHRGAIEGCNVGFLLLCQYLLASPVHELCAIPRRLLKNTLSQISALSKSSVTRRSAGLPLIVQSIISSEARTKQTQLLREAVTTLLSVLRDPPPACPDQTEDIPHVHATNILRAVVKDAAVSQAITPYVATTTSTAIDLLSSPLWAVRNSAMQLYGVLQSRLLGQKKTSDDRLHTTTVQEFFSLHPDLRPYMMAKVKVAAEALGAGGLTLHPSLFPVLSILAKLMPGMGSTEVISDFLAPIQTLCGSSLYAVRCLSAHALTALVPREEAAEVARCIVREIPESPEGGLSYNKLHGQILQLSYITRDSPPDPELLCLLSSRSWILGHDNPCHLMRAAGITLVSALGGLKSGTTLYSLDTIAEQIARSSSTEKKSVTIGYSDFVKAVIECWLDQSADPESDQSEALCDKIKTCLGSDEEDVRLACLQWLDANLNIKSKKMSLNNYQPLLLLHLLRDPSWEELCVCLRLLLDGSANSLQLLLDGSPDSDPSVSVGALWECLMALVRSHKGSYPGAMALAVSAMVLRSSLGNKQFSPADVLEWSGLVRSYSAPTNSEIWRQYSARAVSIVGETLLARCQQPGDDQLVYRRVVFRLLDSILDLLQDEYSHIRNLAAQCVVTMATDGQQKQLLHHNVAMTRLCEFITNLPPTLDLVQWLYMKIVDTSRGLVEQIKLSQLNTVEEQFEASDLNPYEEPVTWTTHFMGCAKSLPLTTASSDITVYMTNEDKVLTEEIQTVISVIEELCTDARLLLLYKKAVFQRVHSVLCRASVLAAWCQTLGVDQSCVTPATTLQTMLRSHPALCIFDTS